MGSQIQNVLRDIQSSFSCTKNEFILKIIFLIELLFKMGSEIAKALKVYTVHINDCYSTLSRLNASYKDVKSTPFYQEKKCEFEKKFEKLKSDLDVFKSEIETDIQIFSAIKRSILRLEEIFKTFIGNKTKIMDEKTHINIKTIFHDQILEQIENYEKILENRKNFSEFQKKLENSKIPLKKVKAFGAGLLCCGGVCAIFGYVGSSENCLGGSGVAEISKSFVLNGKILLMAGVWCVVVAGLLTRIPLQGADEKIEKDKFYEEYISKLEDFSKSLKNLSLISQRPTMNLGQKFHKTRKSSFVVKINKCNLTKDVLLCLQFKLEKLKKIIGFPISVILVFPEF
ncbi:hypothetical protein BpHYR1_054182 [Brachionus plicatilis]|uniref:Uncharacterized protein n=1 Tax=Brachionus plicatilis TaxID=10195 RepID=A0A3M7P3V9_BRAPC|nr:hypothetical protein BpHYR1_054182 [Brachionus plicatilis]